MPDLVTAELLADAIVQHTGLSPEEALRDAEYVMGIFGFGNAIIDNVLEPSERQLFYMLQDWGLLTTRREYSVLPDGRDWQTNYWFLRTERIFADAGARGSIEGPTPGLGSVYAELPSDAWRSRA